MIQHPKILFLEIAAGGGHLSITQAIIDALKDIAPQVEPVRLDFNLAILGKGYESWMRNYPQIFNLFYKATDNQRMKNIISKSSQSFTSRYLRKAITTHQPKIIVTDTLFGITEIPSMVKKLHKRIPFLIFVPDPFTPHAVFYQPDADLTMVGSLTAYQRGLKAGIDPNKLVITGHPVRKDFFQTPDIQRLRTKLGLNPLLPTFVLGGSGGGVEKTQKILEYLSQSKNPKCQIIVLCGNHKDLVNELKSNDYPNWMELHILGHINNVSDYIHAADFVAAKAGPNILLECLAAGKPFIVTHHIHGQENGNVDFIRSTQSGFVEEHPEDAAKLISKIIQNPEILKKAAPGVEFVRNQHRPAAQTIASYIARYL